MRLVTRRVPATESQPPKSKRGRYQIDDHFLRFWFRYVHPNQASLDLGLTDAILDQRVKPNLDSFASIAFEESSRDFIGRLARNNQLPFTPERIGSWWERDAEIDVLALNRVQGHALVGECKWSVNPVGVDILDELKRKAKQLNKEGEIPNLHYALFARTGFTSALEQRAKEDGILVFTVEDMVQPTRK